jgi:hypothetical protein
MGVFLEVRQVDFEGVQDFGVLCVHLQERGLLREADFGGALGW